MTKSEFIISSCKYSIGKNGNSAKSSVKIFHLVSLDDEVRKRKYDYCTKTSFL